jgi:galactose-1-phosphate uridylyltransferase
MGILIAMTIEFNKTVVECHFLDPNNNFQETIFPLEIRHDPLTGRSSLVYHGMGYPPLNKPHPAELQAQSDSCPFCPANIDKVTPRFPENVIAGGKIKVNQALVLPNIRPYSQYSAVVLFSLQHIVGMDEFTRELLTDAFVAGQLFARKIVEYDPKARNLSIGWNYMAPSGATMSHPHLQFNLGIFPVPAQEELEESSQEHHKKYGKNFWQELIEQERETDERYVATIGDVCWLTSFAPRGRLFDLLAIFRGKSSFLELTEKDLSDFSTGMLLAFKDLKEHGFYSFNLAIRSSPGFSRYFFCHARIIARFTFLPTGVSDASYMETLDKQMFSRISPEQMCRGLRKHFSEYI